jgi:hypothetical protein
MCPFCVQTANVNGYRITVRCRHVLRFAKRELLCVGNKVGLGRLGVQTASKLLVQRNSCRQTAVGADFAKLTLWRRNFFFLNFSTPCI